MDKIYEKSESMIEVWNKSSFYPKNLTGDIFTDLSFKGDLESLREYYEYLSESDKRDTVKYAGNRPLRMAAKNKNLNCLIYLIEECGADLHAQSDNLDNISMISAKDAAITHACINDDYFMLGYLLSKHPEKLCTDHRSRNTTSDLSFSISRGHIDIVRKLLEHGKKKNSHS
jgi:hypothetical protein